MSSRYEVTWERDSKPYDRSFKDRVSAETFGRNMRGDDEVTKLELWELTELRTLLIEENPMVRSHQVGDG
jgi:hypothetical protein